MKHIYKTLEKYNLHLKNMTGIYADGTNANLSLFRGVTADFLIDKYMDDLDFDNDLEENLVEEEINNNNIFEQDSTQIEQVIEDMSKDIVLKCAIDSNYKFIPCVDIMHVISLVAKMIILNPLVSDVSKICETIMGRIGYEIRMLSFIRIIYDVLKDKNKVLLLCNQFYLMDDECCIMVEIFDELLKLKSLADG